MSKSNEFSWLSSQNEKEEEDADLTLGNFIILLKSLLRRRPEIAGWPVLLGASGNPQVHLEEKKKVIVLSSWK